MNRHIRPGVAIFCLWLPLVSATDCRPENDGQPVTAPVGQAQPGAANAFPNRGALLTGIRGAVQPLSGTPRDYDRLMTMVGDAQFVLLGEATHGTHEFYRERARITQRLIKEKGFA